MTCALDLWLTLAGFVAQHIRKSCSCKKRGICGTTISANPAVAKNAGFVARHYLQILRSQKNAGFVALHCPLIPQSQKNAGFVELHYPQIPRPKKNAGFVTLHYPQITNPAVPKDSCDGLKPLREGRKNAALTNVRNKN
jgi:hypothetical protein